MGIRTRARPNVHRFRLLRLPLSGHRLKLGLGLVAALAAAATVIVLTSRDDSPARVTVVEPADGAVIAEARPRFTGRADGAEAVTVRVFAGRRLMATASAPVGADGWFSATSSRRLPAGSYTALLRKVAGSRVVGEDRRHFVRWDLGSEPPAPGRLGGGARPSQTGPLGRPTAVAFDGRSAFAVVPDSIGLDATKGATVGAWVLRSGSGRWQVIVGKPADGRSKLENYGLWLDESDRAVAFFGDGSRYVRVETPAALDKRWHFVVATYDGSTATIFLDGVAVATKHDRLRLTPNGEALNVGRAHDQSSYLNGSLDGVVVATRALSRSGVQRLYERAATADGDPPRVTLSTPAPQTTTRDATPAFAGTASATLLDEPTVAVRIWKGPRMAGGSLMRVRGLRFRSGAWNARPDARLQPGVYTARAEQRDRAGNRGFSAPTTFTIRAGEPIGGRTILAAGDIADCGSSGDEHTAALLDRLAGTVVTLGDHAYDWGTARDFADCYAPTWGRHRNRTRPAIGGHEYGAKGGDASTYFRYFHSQLARFGSSATDQRRGWYSYDLGGWHVVVLNTSWREVGLPTPTSEQVRWLKEDLEAHRSRCTLAVWHDPVFSSGLNGGSSSYRPLWDALYVSGAELVLNGHDHDYERFAPQDPSGAYDPVRGIREIVVGTGGASHYSFAEGRGILANSEVRDDTAFGVLRVTLRPRGYEWQFIPAGGATFTDAGSSACH